MKIIDRLNEDLDYNKEILILSLLIGLILFLSSGFLLKIYLLGAVFLVLMGAFALGIATSYYIYERAEFVTYGTLLRDKIRGWFGK